MRRKRQKAGQFDRARELLHLAVYGYRTEPEWEGRLREQIDAADVSELRELAEELWPPALKYLPPADEATPKGAA